MAIISYVLKETAKLNKSSIMLNQGETRQGGEEVSRKYESQQTTDRMDTSDTQLPNSNCDCKLTGLPLQGDDSRFNKSGVHCSTGIYYLSTLYW